MDFKTYYIVVVFFTNNSLFKKVKSVTCKKKDKIQKDEK